MLYMSIVLLQFIIHCICSNSLVGRANISSFILEASRMLSDFPKILDSNRVSILI